MAAKDEAGRYLSDAPPEQCFWVNNGPILKNLEDLASALSEMKDETFKYHANKNKNDFSAWLVNVIGDKKLADGLMSSRSRESALKKVRSRLNSLRKKAL